MNIDIRPPRLLVGYCAVALITFCAGTAAAVEPGDCADELQQIPRDGSVVESEPLWLSYSGNISYGGVAGVADEDVALSSPEGGDVPFSLENLETKSHTGLKVSELGPGEYSWRIGQGPEAAFTVADSVASDETPPTIDEGPVEASLELLVYEEFPVIFREWVVSFPSGSDDTTDVENLRYLVKFQWADEVEGEESATILVTPDRESASEEVISVGLGGRAEKCRHAEPEVALTAEVELEVRVIDLSGNISEEAATGTFDGVTEEQLTEAHAEFDAVIKAIEGHQPDSAPTSAEVAEELQAEEDEADEEASEEEEDAEPSSGCAAVGGKVGGGGPGGSVAMLLFVLGGLLVRRKTAYSSSD